MLIIIGLLLLLMAILFALPFFGVGMVLPLVGDVIDIPLSFVFAVVGIILLVLGGLLSVLVEYWWVLAIVFAILFIFYGIKTRWRILK